MTSLLTKFVVKKIFNETPLKKSSRAQNLVNQPTVDPYFETVPATRLGFKTTKKRKKALPPGLTPNEEAVLTKVKSRAYHLDLALFSLCGLRFGWSSVIGLIPALGDFGDMLLALMVYRLACSVEGGLSTSTKTKMQMNIVVDFVIGLVPFLGDLADAAWKCNTKNAVLLEEELRERGRKRIRESGVNYPDVDPSLAGDWDDEPPRYEQDQRGQNSRHREDDVEAQRPVRPERAAKSQR